MSSSFSRLRGGRAYALAVGVFLVLGMLHMLPVWGSCDSTILGGPGDSTSGGIWLNWQYDELNTGPWPDKTPYVSAPWGESLWNPIFITAATIRYPMWLLNVVLSPVCSWNLMVLAGFVASGVVMFGFARWLTGSMTAGFFAGYAYAFSPYHMYKAQGHIGYVHSYLLVIILWAGLSLWRRPTWKSALALGVGGALAGYTDGYYILLAPVGIAVLFGSLLIYDAVQRKPLRYFLDRLRFLLLGAACTAILLLPVGAVLLRNTSTITSSFDRPRSDLILYSARATEYFLPARSHPVFSKVFGEYQDSHLHNSNYSEQTLFLGWTVISLAAAALLLVLVRRRQRRGPLAGMPEGSAVASLLAVTAVGVWFSAPPTIYALGLEIPAPSGFIFDRVGFWRVYARFFLLIHASLVALAAVGFARVLSLVSQRMQGRSSVRAKAVLSGVILLVLAFEFATVPPFNNWDYSEAPDEYEWLAQRDDVTTVAEYPLLIPPAHDAYGYLTYQVVHEKRLVNSAQVSEQHQEIRNGIHGLADPQTAPVLRRMGVGVVLYHSHHDPLAASLPPPDGFTIVERFAKSRTMALTLDRGPVARVALAIDRGWHSPELRGWSTSRWMSGRGELRLFSFDATAEAAVAFQAKSFEVPRDVTVRQGKRVLWQGQVGLEDTAVRFIAKTGLITVETDPGPATGPGADIRPKTIYVTGFSSEAM